MQDCRANPEMCSGWELHGGRSKARRSKARRSKRTCRKRSGGNRHIYPAHILRHGGRSKARRSKRSGGNICHTNPDMCGEMVIW